MFMSFFNGNIRADQLNTSNTAYAINRLEVNNNKNNSNCSNIFTFKYDSTAKLNLIHFNDDEISNDYVKYKQLIAVKNYYELILLVFDDLPENGTDVSLKEYSIRVGFV
jgi:hypothetical protein